MHVINAREDHDTGVIVIDFDDGYRAVFVPNAGGFGEPCFEEVRLERAESVAAVFRSDQQYPINRRPFGFFLHNQYSRTTALEYWDAATSIVLSDRSSFSSQQALSVWVRELAEIRSGSTPTQTLT